MGIGIILVLIELVMNQFESILVKRYGEKYGEGGMLFNAIICLFAMLYFFVTDTNGLLCPSGIIIFGLVNSIMYAVGFYSMYVAFKTGSFGFTRLFSSFGVVISTFYGIIFLDEPTTVITYIAFIMILVSLLLMNYQKKEGEEEQITSKWIIHIIITILANSLIVIIGRMQFGIFGDTYSNEFLIISLGGAAIYLLAMGVLFERDSLKTTFKYGLLYGAGAGIFNGINNLIILITYNYLPISFTAPVKSGLGMLLCFLVSVFLYKEKFNRRQLVSVIIGVVAVALMNF